MLEKVKEEKVIEDKDQGKVKVIEVAFFQQQLFPQQSLYYQLTEDQWSNIERIINNNYCQYFPKTLTTPDQLNIKHEPIPDRFINSVELANIKEPPSIYDSPIITIELLDQCLQVTSRIIVVLSDVRLHPNFVQISWRFSV